MAVIKYKLKKGTIRTPEEYREIQEQIDKQHKLATIAGVKKSTRRIKNTFGVSSNMYKKERKPKNKKPRIYDKNRFINNMGNHEYRE